jgi:hypothetical protein
MTFEVLMLAARIVLAGLWSGLFGHADHNPAAMDGRDFRNLIGAFV